MRKMKILKRFGKIFDKTTRKKNNIMDSLLFKGNRLCVPRISMRENVLKTYTKVGLVDTLEEARQCLVLKRDTTIGK